MDTVATLSKVSTYSAADIEQSLEDALRVINSWPAWKIASMLDSDSELPKELLDKFLVNDNT